MKQRRCAVERLFGTLKFWTGLAHFLMKPLNYVGTEMSLHVLAYNPRRVINILCVEELVKSIRTSAV